MDGEDRRQAERRERMKGEKQAGGHAADAF